MPIFDASQLNPIKLYHQADAFALFGTNNTLNAFPSQYNHRHMDDDFMYRNLKSWQDKVKYFQPYQQSDVLVLQWLGTNSLFVGIPYAVNIINCKGEVVKQKLAYTPATLGPDTIWQIKLGLYDVPEGIYWVQISYNGFIVSPNQYLISEPIEVKVCHENTMLYEYKNTYNDQHVIWAYDQLRMQIRVHSAFTEMNTANKSYVYDSEPLNPCLVSAIPYREWQITFGMPTHYIPEWMADKMERVFSCDTVTVDGKLFTRKEGSTMEPKRIVGHPLAQWNLVVRENENRNDTVVDSTYSLLLGQLPTTDLFYVKGLYLNAFSTFVNPLIETYFRGADAFVNYLNGEYMLNYLPSTIGNFAVDDLGRLIFKTTDFASWNAFNVTGLQVAGILPYGLEIGIASNGNANWQIELLGSQDYAVVWGDGTQINLTSVTNVVVSLNHTYTVNKKHTAYIFCTDAYRIGIYFPTAFVESLGGNLPANLEILEVQSNILRNVKNNIFLSCIGAINTILLDGNVLDTNEVNKLIVYMYEALINNSLSITGANTLDLSLQIPSAPESSEPGIQNFIYQLTQNNWTVITD